MNRKRFYHSKAWKDVKKGIWLKQSCLCNRCGKPVYVDGISEFIPKEKRLIGIVHHKVYLNDSNYTDDSVALNPDNLEGICIDCHNQEHFKIEALKKGYAFDDDGQLVPSDTPRNHPRNG